MRSLLLSCESRLSKILSKCYIQTTPALGFHQESNSPSYKAPWTLDTVFRGPWAGAELKAASPRTSLTVTGGAMQAFKGEKHSELSQMWCLWTTTSMNRAGWPPECINGTRSLPITNSSLIWIKPFSLRGKIYLVLETQSIAQNQQCHGSGKIYHLIKPAESLNYALNMFLYTHHSSRKLFFATDVENYRKKYTNKQNT